MATDLAKRNGISVHACNRALHGNIRRLRGDQRRNPGATSLPVTSLLAMPGSTSLASIPLSTSTPIMNELHSSDAICFLLPLSFAASLLEDSSRAMATRQKQEGG